MNCLGHIRKVNGEVAMGQKRLPDRAGIDHVPDEAGAGVGPIRTVVVNDSPIILKTLSCFLEQQQDFQLVGSATDGNHAVRRAMELQPDLVLMGLRLTGMNGLEATRQIKARSQAPAVIMVAANDTPACRAAARAAGTDGFVGKQNLFSQLRTAIRKLFPGATL
jgi:DNA-binding NarL/FixJ family response regulator